MTENEFKPLIPSKKPVTEGEFDPVVPPLQTDFEGGKSTVTHVDTPLFGASESLVADMEDKLDLNMGELTSDDPSDPNYKPAYTRTDKWGRFKETGEI